MTLYPASFMRPMPMASSFTKHAKALIWALSNSKPLWQRPKEPLKKKVIKGWNQPCQPHHHPGLIWMVLVIWCFQEVLPFHWRKSIWVLFRQERGMYYSTISDSHWNLDLWHWIGIKFGFWNIQTSQSIGGHWIKLIFCPVQVLSRLKV